MIQVEIRKEHSHIVVITVKGHAESGPYGQDLVCSAVSAIMIGTLNAIDEMFPEACRLKMGKTISIEVVHNSHDLQIVLEMMRWQLCSVEEISSDFLQIRETEQTE